MLHKRLKRAEEQLLGALRQQAESRVQPCFIHPLGYSNGTSPHLYDTPELSYGIRCELHCSLVYCIPFLVCRQQVYLFSSSPYKWVWYDQNTMQLDIFSQLYTRFEALAHTDTTVTDIEEYLSALPHATLKTHYALVPVFFQRVWIVTCINGHIHRARNMHRLLKKGADRAQILHTHTTALLWLGQAQRLFEAAHYLLTHITHNTIHAHRLLPHEVKLGDVVLSYKTGCYLQHSPLSRFIKYTTHSAVTHVIIASNEEGKSPELLMSDDTTRGLGFYTVQPDPGELFLILEPLPHPNLHRVHNEIRRLRDIAYTKLHNTSLEKEYGFPELKCEIACIIGVLHILAGLFFRFPLSVGNILKWQSGTFCSEFIDSLFMNAGIQLLPRSEHPAVVGPIELLYSPHLRIKGVIGDAHTLTQAEFEIEKQLGISDPEHPIHQITCR